MTPKEKSIQLCDMVYHSSMGDGWHPFVVGRAKQIANELIQEWEQLKSEDCSIALVVRKIRYWEEVKEEIDKIKLK